MVNKHGSTYIIALMATAVIYIIAISFVYFSRTSWQQELMDKHRTIAKYLSEAGIERGLNTVYNTFYSPLVDIEKKKLNFEKLNLLDPELASDYSKVLEMKDFIEGGDVYVGIEVLNITADNRLASSIKIVPGEEDKVPERLNIYKQGEDGSSGKKLGGYIATLKVTSKGVFKNREYTTTITKSMKVCNISPLAEEYTLFIHGKKEEYLRYGRFVLSNWTIDMKEVANLVNKIKELGERAKIQLPSTSINDFSSMLNYVKQFVIANKDSDVKQEASKLLFNLDFRKWGRVRTNGTLHVYLPFFEVDDIINYFVENQYYSKPEVGHISCYNRLHNLYLGKYTRYEGNIRKHYYRLAPYILSRRFPVERNDKYTRFSTDSYYPQEHPDEQLPSNFILTKPGDIDKFLYQDTESNLELRGTQMEPVVLNGIYSVEGNLQISGYIKGKGVIIVKGNVILDGNVRKSDDSSLLSIVAINSPIIVRPEAENIELDACIYSKESIKGGKKIKINGNYVVENLNRQSGKDARDTTMPDDFEVVYNDSVRNYYGRHIYGGISLKSKSKYLNELSDSDIDRLKTKQKNMSK